MGLASSLELRVAYNETHFRPIILSSLTCVDGVLLSKGLGSLSSFCVAPHLEMKSADLLLAVERLDSCIYDKDTGCEC